MTATVPLEFSKPPSRAASAGSRIRIPLDFSIAPVDALRALLPLEAALLESRTPHPGARYSYVAFGPTRELELHPTYAQERAPGGRRTFFPGAPWSRLDEWFEPPGVSRSADVPFTGGWIGYLAHEAASWILGTPAPPPTAPARPALPWGFFRFYPDVLVYDLAKDERFLLGNDQGEGARDVERRLEGAERRLRRQEIQGHRAPAPRARNDPETTMDEPTFQRRVGELQRLIREGDCFQANLTSSYAYPWESAPTREGLVSLYEEYARANPGAWGGYFEAPGCTLLSASPELLAQADARGLKLRPIAGTRPRGTTLEEDDRLARELQADEKERAEHAMLVDLARNDAAAVCEPGTVRVTNLAGVERYRHVMHLVSEVEGTLPRGLPVRRLLEAVFPGGTVTGCPKRRAVQRIAELEGSPRGPYTGTLGYVSMNGNTAWNLLIRTLIATPTHLVAHAGCGIVEGSRAEAETRELEAKARAQVEAALGRGSPAPAEARCGHVEPGPAWSPGAARPIGRPCRVLLVDFEDSFVNNVADYCRRLGADALVHGAHEPWHLAWRLPPTHVIFSPGPGRPEDFPAFEQHLAEARRRRVPVLGVCLGHQALAQHAGARIVRHPETVHGRSSRILPTDSGRRDPVLGAWGSGVAARYHSLIATQLPPSLEPLARLEDGTCMALRVRDRPWWGVQFHPESLLTQHGLHLLRAFLEVGPDE